MINCECQIGMCGDSCNNVEDLMRPFVSSEYEESKKSVVLDFLEQYLHIYDVTKCKMNNVMFMYSL